MLTLKVIPLDAAPTFEYPVPAPFLTLIPLFAVTVYVPVLYEAELPGEGGNLKVRSPSHTVQTRPLNMTNGPLLSATDMWEKVSFLLASDFQLS